MRASTTLRSSSTHTCDVVVSLAVDTPDDRHWLPLPDARRRAREIDAIAATCFAVGSTSCTYTPSISEGRFVSAGPRGRELPGAHRPTRSTVYDGLLVADRRIGTVSMRSSVLPFGDWRELSCHVEITRLPSGDYAVDFGRSAASCPLPRRHRACAAARCGRVDCAVAGRRAAASQRARKGGCCHARTMGWGRGTVESGFQTWCRDHGSRDGANAKGGVKRRKCRTAGRKNRGTEQRSARGARGAREGRHRGPWPLTEARGGAEAHGRHGPAAHRPIRSAPDLDRLRRSAQSMSAGPPSGNSRCRRAARIVRPPPRSTERRVRRAAAPPSVAR